MTVQSQSKQGSAKQGEGHAWAAGGDERIRRRDIKRFCRYHEIPRPGDMLHPGYTSWTFDAWTTKHPESVRLVKAKMTRGHA